MDPVDIDKLIEKAKADASATGAKEAPTGNLDRLDDEAKTSEASSIFQVSDDQVEDLSQRVMDLAEEDVADEELAKSAALERAGHLKVAKLLTALDVFSGVNR